MYRVIWNPPSPSVPPGPCFRCESPGGSSWTGPSGVFSGPSEASLGLVRGNCLSDWGGAVVCSEGCDGNVGLAAVRCVVLHRGQICPLLEADRHRFRHHGVDFFRNAGQPINLFDYEPNHDRRYEPATTLVSMTARS